MVPAEYLLQASKGIIPVRISAFHYFALAGKYTIRYASNHNYYRLYLSILLKKLLLHVGVVRTLLAEE